MDHLNEKKIRETGVLESREVNRIVEEHLTGQCDNTKYIWNILCLAVWFDSR